VVVYTIGFTKKSAAEFFAALKGAGVAQLVDVRLNNTGQLAGFSKRDDLAYFLHALLGARYVHQPLLAPTDDLLTAYRRKALKWPEYERRFRDLLAQRRVEERLDRALFAQPSVLLCSEATAERCHRRLALEYLQQAWGELEIVHL
jgi:uncharacterized protein (DUF488 family)